MVLVSRNSCGDGKNSRALSALSRTISHDSRSLFSSHLFTSGRTSVLGSSQPGMRHSSAIDVKDSRNRSSLLAGTQKTDMFGYVSLSQYAYARAICVFLLLVRDEDVCGGLWPSKLTRCLQDRRAKLLPVKRTGEAAALISQGCRA